MGLSQTDRGTGGVRNHTQSSLPMTAGSDAYVAGTGSEVVLLHGLCGTWRIWEPVISLLEQRHRIIAMTLPGHDGGCPLQPGTEPTIAALTELLVAELAKRGIRTAHLVGNSLGGWLALELARRGVARSVVVFSPAGAWSTPQDYARVARSFRLLFALVPIVIAATTWFLGSASLRRTLGRLTMEHGNRIPAAKFRAMLRAVAHTGILPRLLEAMGRDGPIEPLPAGCVPIRVVWGAQDQVIPFEQYGRPMVERIAGAEQMILPGVGHVPMYDDPEAVTAAILQVTAAVDARQRASRV